MFDFIHHKATGPSVLLVAGLALTGCNNLNGLDDVSVDGDNDGSSGGAVETPGPKQLACAYPADANFGVAQGQIVPVTRNWQGFSEGALEPGQINITDFYDCDGSRGIDALVVDTSQYN